MEMDNDDLPIGRVLSRRETLRLLGAGGLLWLGGCGGGSGGVAVPTATPRATANPNATATPTANPNATATPTTAPNTTSCVVRPELTEGPYFVDERLNRSDIRTDTSTGTARAGQVLVLTFNVSRVVGGACAALSGAMVDVWHCDALGDYSDIASEGTSGQNFLRGYQLTNSGGVARFTTIYPGWYQGRAVHMHFKIRLPSLNASSDFTSQLFFPDATSSTIYTQSPYSSKGNPEILNAADGIYRQGGSQLLLTPTRSGSTYAANLNIGLQV